MIGKRSGQQENRWKYSGRLLVNQALVQDRILYNLHNTRELMIMQMREKREGSKREVKSDPAGTHADLEITERCRQDFGGCADLD